MDFNRGNLPENVIVWVSTASSLAFMPLRYHAISMAPVISNCWYQFFERNELGFT